MSHFARVENGIVKQVIVADQEFIDNTVFDDPGEWIKTSYNTKGGVHYQGDGETPSDDQSKALRKNYACVGYTYDVNKDAFIPPQPYDSWTLNETTCLWEAPVEKPDDGNSYNWNEETTNWILAEE